MLRVGLTGGLASGKSTVARMLAQRGAHVLSADEIGRALMQPGEAVYKAIVAKFGSGVVSADGLLDRKALAKLAFAGGLVEDLNAIVHPATIARQIELCDAAFASDPHAIVVVESALIFETKHGEGWRERFDAMVLVTAPDELKVTRYIARSHVSTSAGETAADSALGDDARRRLSQMMPDEDKRARCDYVLENTGSLEALEQTVAELWSALVTQEARHRSPAQALP